MIDLYTADTPNGYKISIALEELALPYEAHIIDLGAGQQKEPWFVKLNPNGRIPVIVDREADLPVFDSGAILIYLAEKTGKLLPAKNPQRSGVIQWLMFQMSGIGPMQGQLAVFSKYAPQRIPYAIERYEKETMRLYSIVNDALADRPFLAGDEYSIADIATFPWIHAHAWSGLSVDDLPNLRRWLDRLSERPAVRKGLTVPPRREDQTRLDAAKAMVSSP